MSLAGIVALVSPGARESVKEHAAAALGFGGEEAPEPENNPRYSSAPAPDAGAPDGDSAAERRREQRAKRKARRAAAKRAAAKRKAKRRRRRGVLVVRANVRNARFFLDGALKGKSRRRVRIRTAAGVHKLRVVARWRRPVVRKVRVYPGKTRRIFVRLKKRRRRR